MIDAGDTIQGTQLSYYYAKVDPITARRGPVHPMAQAMNAIGYDAAALGNHEFNYGIPVLRKFEEQCDFPLLGANALDAKTLRPAFAPYSMHRLRTPYGRDVKVAVLGLTNPGIAIWDKANVQGKMTFPGLEEQAAKYVPKLRSMGADVVIVSAHSGSSGTSSYGDQLPYIENSAGLVAEQVPGIDAILVGHAHTEIPEYRVKNKATGKDVVLSEPLKWGQRLTLFDFELTWSKGCWSVAKVSAKVLNSNTAVEDPKIVRLLSDEHRKVVAYVNQVIGTSVQAMSSADGPVKDVAIIDLINHVQADTVKGAGGHAVGGAAGAVAGVVLLAYGGDSGRAGDDQGCCGPVPVREHDGGAAADGCAAEGLPGVLGAVLRADGAGCSGGPGEADEFRGRPGLQLRRGVRAVVRHRRRAAGGFADLGAFVPGEGGGSGCGVRAGGEQLPGVGWRELPARAAGQAAVGEFGGDPQHDHPVGEGEGDDRPGPVRVGGLAADPGRGSGVLAGSPDAS